MTDLRTMKAVQLKGCGVVAVESVPIPVPERGEALLKVIAAGVCQTDIHLRHDPSNYTPRGTILGHEIAGEIVALGEAGTGDWTVGARVVVHPCWACRNCSMCHSGRENACQGNGARLIPPPTPGVTVNGGMAEFVRVPVSALVAIGDLDPAIAAVLADAGLAPYHSVRLVRDRLVSGTTAVVIGVGGLGQFAVQMLRLETAAKIVAVDISENALSLVSRYVDATIRADTQDAAEQILSVAGPGGAEVVIDLVGNDASLRLAASIVAPYGAIQAIGLNAGTLPFEADQRSSVSLPWGVTLMKPYSGSYRDLSDVIALAQAGKLDASIIRFPLDEAVSAFDQLEAGNISGRAVLMPCETSSSL